MLQYSSYIAGETRYHIVIILLLCYILTATVYELIKCLGSQITTLIRYIIRNWENNMVCFTSIMFRLNIFMGFRPVVIDVIIWTPLVTYERFSNTLKSSYFDGKKNIIYEIFLCNVFYKQFEWLYKFLK